MKAVIEFLNAGGVWMYVLLSMSIASFAIILERWVVLQLNYGYKGSLFSKIIRKIQSGDYRSAQSMCQGTRHPLAKVIMSIMNNYEHGQEAMESGASIEMKKIVPKIQKRTGLLQMLGNVATLVGLLGTIQGLIVSFSSLAGAEASEKAEMLGRGISTAMNTTAFGLIVAIPCIVAYVLLTGKENKILAKYDEALNEVLHTLSHEVVESPRRGKSRSSRGRDYDNMAV
jgi:biopolymer transport protein ExbB/TolQ